MKLKNRVAIVAGGSRGIGKAICYLYSQQGATTIVVNKSHPEEGERVAKQIREKGGVSEAMACDISDPDSVAKLVDCIHTKYNRIDILTNCAGVLLFKDFESHSIEEWDFVIRQNLRSSFIISKATVPYMKEQRHGKIILFSSLAAIRGVSGAIAYAASKGGVLAMAKSMVSELASFGINVNTISPGFTATPMNQKLRDDPGFMRQIKLPPSGNALLQPDDIANAALFLASDESQNVHGLDLVVDGGATTTQ